MSIDSVLFGLVAFLGGLIAIPVGGSFLFLIPGFLFLGMNGLHAVFLGRLAMVGAMGSATGYFSRSGGFDVREIGGFFIGNLIGVLGGTLIATRIDADLFTKIVPWILLVGGIFMVADIKIQKPEHQHVIRILLPLFGLILGLYAGIGGGGNGKMIVLLLVLALGWKLRQAIVNTRFIELFTNILAVVGYFIFGVSLTGFEIPVLVGAFLGGLLGAKVTLHSKPEWLKYGFLMLVLISAIKVTFFS